MACGVAPFTTPTQGCGPAARIRCFASGDDSLSRVPRARLANRLWPDRGPMQTDRRSLERSLASLGSAQRSRCDCPRFTRTERSMAHLLPKPLYRRRLTTARMFGQRVQPAVCFSGGGVIAAGGGELAGAAFPEVAERVGFAEVVGGQLQQRLGALVPELFAPFDAAVDLLNCRFDVTGGDRQAFLPIGGGLLF